MRSELGVGLLLCAALSGCSGQDPGGDDDGGGGGGGGGDGFEVSGTVRTASARRIAADAEGDKHVDLVVAVTPSSQELRRVVAEVGDDGSFALDLEPSRPWILVFVDSSRVGADMIAGILGAGTLDTLAPTSSGALALGDVAVDGSSATPGLSYQEIVEGLGLTDETAAWLGEIDDVCLRYVNPDLDADGVVDAFQPEVRFLLDFHVQRELRQAGEVVTMADVVGQFLALDTTATYRGTGIYVSYPQAFLAAEVEPTLSFSQALYYDGFVEGGQPGDAAMLPADTALTGDALIRFDYADMSSVGVAAAAGHDLPQGEVRAGLGDTTVTFTAVRTSTDAELAAGDGLVMPFLRVAPVEAGCGEACAIASIDYEWRRRGEGGWSVVPADQLALLVPEAGGFLSVVVGRASASEVVTVKIPSANPTGSLPWAPDSVELSGGLDPAGFANITTDDLCHVGLSYDDRLGQRHFASMFDAPGTCQ